MNVAAAVLLLPLLWSLALPHTLHLHNIHYHHNHYVIVMQNYSRPAVTPYTHYLPPTCEWSTRSAELNCEEAGNCVE